MNNIAESLYQAAQNRPDQVAIYDDSGAMTYAELANAVRQTTRDLRLRGIGPGFGVGVMGRNSRYFIISAIAVMDCGAVVLPVSNQIKADELEEILRTARIHFLLDDQSGPRCEAEPAGMLTFPDNAWRIFKNPAADYNRAFAGHVAEAALIRFTSGTTGTSKGVILSHTTIWERTQAANRALQLGPGDTIVWVMSMAYHFVVSIILYLRYGATILICPDFLAETIIDLTNRHQATFLYAAPLHIRLLTAAVSGAKMPSLRRVISTSTGISAAQCTAFTERFGLPVSQAYGIIEIGLPIINMEKSEAFPDAVGYALPDYEVAILNDAGERLPAGSTGHLAIRGPGMLDAYLEPARSRAEILQNGWFMTGDLASMHPDGLIRVEGRKKSMINVAGNKVFPEEVEAVLNQHPAVQACRVSGFTHPFLGEAVQAEVVLRAGNHPTNSEALRVFCQQQLSAFKVPQKISFVEKLPMTDSGKLVRF